MKEKKFTAPTCKTIHISKDELIATSAPASMSSVSSTSSAGEIHWISEPEPEPQPP